MLAYIGVLTATLIGVSYAKLAERRELRSAAEASDGAIHDYWTARRQLEDTFCELGIGRECDQLNAPNLYRSGQIEEI